MKVKNIDISSFAKSSSFYGRIDALVTIKSFDLQAIRQRYIKSRSNKGGKTGSVERRIPAVGGLANIRIEDGRLVKDDVLLKIKEPRALHIAHKKFSFAAENVVFVLNEDGEIQRLENPWFSYVHTVQFHPNNEDKLLISSSGFDLILEYDLKSHEQTYEWLAWEHGINEAIDPKTGNSVILTRQQNVDLSALRNDQSLMVISDPLKDALPTAKRAAFINSVTYDIQNPENLLATLFHKGAVYSINMNSGVATPILEGLKNPHGGHRLADNIIGTSTGTGEVHIQHSLETKTVYSVRQLPGKPAELAEMEWVQNTATIEDIFISIDANRTSFIIFDPKNKQYDIIPFDDNWAVQDIALGTINERQISAIKSIS